MSALRGCQPEQSWQDREWWHWLLAPSGKEVLARWHLNGDGETWVWAIPGHGAGSADFMLRHGYRYLGPIAAWNRRAGDDEVEKLREALRAVVADANGDDNTLSVRTANMVLAALGDTP